MSNHYATYPSLKDRIVLISGGSEGIGASLVEAFVLQGSKVIFLDISDDAAKTLVDRFQGRDNPPVYHHCDLTNVTSLQATANDITSRYGRVDVLINNAANDARISTEQVTPVYWDKCVAVNLRHFFFLIQAIIPYMQKAKSGSIINMGSITWAIPATGLPVYTACKAAVVGLTKTHAHEFGKDGIRVNSIMPGAIATERQKREIHTPEYEALIMERQALKRTLGPEEVARLALFLAADDSSAITNQSFIADGGWI